MLLKLIQIVELMIVVVVLVVVAVAISAYCLVTLASAGHTV